MGKERLTAFSDGVIAVIITIMVLDLKAPHDVTFGALRGLLPGFLGYALSFVYVGIYWNNHHHFFQLVERVDGAVMWANLHLLFWLSLIPFATSWLGQHPLAPVPTAAYGVTLLMPALAWWLMQATIIRSQRRDPHQEETLKDAVGHDIKGKLSPPLYLAGILLAFVDSRISEAAYAVVALMWLVPDSRVEKAMSRQVTRGSQQG